MLTGDDKLAAAPASRFAKGRLARVAGAWFEHLFLRFGAGAHLLEPLTKSKHWNAFCWTVIALGILGWIVLFWIVPPFAP